VSEGAAGRWWVLALIVAISSVAIGAAWNYPVMVVDPLLRDLALETPDWGTLWGAISLGLALLSVPAGALGDRIGARSVLALGLLVLAAALGGRTLAESFGAMLATMVGAGAGLALVLANMPKALADVFPARQLGLANGFSQAGVGLGVACTLVGVPRILAAGSDWREISGVLAVALAVLALVWWTTTRDARAPASSARAPLLASLVDVARVRDVRWIALCYGLYLGGYLGAIGYLPLHLQTARGMQPTQVGSALFVGPLAFLLGSLLLPALSDLIGRRRRIYLVGMGVAGLALVGAAVSVDLAFLVGSMFTLGFSTATVSLLFVIPVELPEVGPERAGSAVGLATTVGFLGGLLSTWIGVQLAQHGAALGFGFWAASLVASALLILRVRETGSAA
jgi:predicted MFS family arabinose efflux permease